MFCICTVCLCREWRLIEVDATLKQLEPHRPHLLQLLVCPVTSSCCHTALHVALKARNTLALNCTLMR